MPNFNAWRFSMSPHSTWFLEQRLKWDAGCFVPHLLFVNLGSTPVNNSYGIKEANYVDRVFPAKDLLALTIFVLRIRIQETCTQPFFLWLLDYLSQNTISSTSTAYNLSHSWHHFFLVWVYKSDYYGMKASLFLKWRMFLLKLLQVVKWVIKYLRETRIFWSKQTLWSQKVVQFLHTNRVFFLGILNYSFCHCSYCRRPILPFSCPWDFLF